MKEIFVLGIETSCDETAASVVLNGRKILSNVISSQINFHKKFGGVVPEIASRKHVELIMPVIDQALEEAGKKLDDIDVIGVTYGPGLVGALLVGLMAAKGLAFTSGKPLVGVHHIEGHISANYLENENYKPPFICLVASGGHSHIVNVKDYKNFEIMAQTRDDAAGEAFDKVARALGLGYPGGPKIDDAAKKGNKNAIKFPTTHFGNESLDFSFSGIKTAVINYLHNAEQKGEKINVFDVAASFQEVVVNVLVENTILAAKKTGVCDIAIAGGVASNTVLRERMKSEAEKLGFSVSIPKPILCTDNAAMIAGAAYYEFMEDNISDEYLNAIPALKLGQNRKTEKI